MAFTPSRSDAVTDGVDSATVRDLANADPLDVAIVDGAGDQVTGFGGGTQYAEDTPHVTGDLMNMAGLVRQDADAALSGDGDRTLGQVDALGFVKVNVKAGTVSVVEPVTVDAVDLDIRNLSSATDSVTVAEPVTVDAVDLDIRNLDVAQDDVRVGGMAASDAPVADNPLAAGLRASTALPAAVSADGDAVFAWGNRHGAKVVAVVPHIGLNSDPYNLLHECAQYTTTQTSTILIDAAAGEKIVVTQIQIQTGGTVAGAVQVYFGTGAYTRGTSRAIFDGEFAPSATLKPGYTQRGPFISGANGDDLRVTDSAAINPLTVNVWYYVVT